MDRLKRIAAGAALTLGITMLCGCVMTVDEMYCLPRRSEGYTNLQSVMESAMGDMAFSAPISGENQQPVQMADLNGDGVEEVIVFAKGTQEKPLHIMIFSREAENYQLYAAIDTTGTAFDRVDYVQLDDAPGMELIVGRQVQNQILRSLSVYGFSGSAPERLLTAGYQRYLTCEMNGGDEKKEIVTLGPGAAETDPAAVQVYAMMRGQLALAGEARASVPMDQVKRVVSGKLSDGKRAVFVSGDLADEQIQTDVFVLSPGGVDKVTRSDGESMAVGKLDGGVILPEDIDHDGRMELPELVALHRADQQQQEYAIRWYTLNSQGEDATWQYTYHNFSQGWFLELDEAAVPRMCVKQDGDGQYGFYLQEGRDLQKLWTIYVLTGQDRSAQAAQDYRFVLMKTDTVVYAGELEDAARLMGVNDEQLQQAFHLIQSDWNTGDF